MAKQGKLLPRQRLPKRSRSDESISMRSAETLGRVIGSLQRQLDGVMRKFTGEPAPAPQPRRAKETPARTKRRSVRPRLAASSDPSPSRHPRKKAAAGKRAQVRAGTKDDKRTSRPK
jgi:hypothetical protein